MTIDMTTLADRVSMRVRVANWHHANDSHTWPSTKERALRLGRVGPRLGTGFATLDGDTRGGLSVGHFVVIGGAPGACKTGKLMNLAHNYARGGIPVAILAADESADGLLVRLGQLDGLNRERLEEGEVDEKYNLARMVDSMPLLLVDADESGATLEDVSEALASMRRGDEPSVLLVDSLQTVRASGTESADSPRARIDAAVAAAKHAAKADRHLVIATSEVSRGAYRSRNASEQVEDLAAFKESGGVEYGATLCLVLRSVSGEPDLIDVTVPKNRLGPKTGFRMRFDFSRARLTEVDAPVGDGATVEAKFERVRRDVLEVVRTRPDLRSANRIVRAVGATRTHVLEAIKELEEEKLLVRVDGFFRPGDGASS